MNMPMGNTGGNGKNFSMMKFMPIVCFCLFAGAVTLLIWTVITLRRILEVQERILEHLSPTETEEDRLTDMSMG
ncbi:hypothetical protein ACFLT7_06435 [candidate division KSB1 bacterium]